MEKISASAAGRKDALKPPAIAVVDDDRDVRDALGNLLSALGYSVTTFGSAPDFLASQQRGLTRCLIADVQMPDMNGFELMRHLSGCGDRIPTILVTAYPREPLRAKALNDGAIDYLAKPVPVESLIDSLERALA